MNMSIPEDDISGIITGDTSLEEDTAWASCLYFQGCCSERVVLVEEISGWLAEVLV
jgi:hypothetical protein